MIRGGARALGLAALLMTGSAGAGPAPTIGGARLQPVAFSDLPGWAADDHRAALDAFLVSCRHLQAGAPLRPAASPDAALARACAAALVHRGEARAFLEAWFRPHRIVPPEGEGFLTGYYEPEVDGSLAPDPAFPTPLLARPDDLVTVPAGETLPGLDPALQAARRTETGFEPYPDRAAIETGALGDRARPIAYLRDAVEVFLMQVQGSGRLRLPDGRVARVAYAGRNGRPYTSIGRILVDAGHVPLQEMSLERLKGWLRANPDEAAAVMRRNESYIFFRLADELDPADGPIGGAGHPLRPGRSLAVDRTLWPYGLPFFLEGTLPRADGGAEPLDRLMVAQDTGSAILGPARGDFFFGSGAEAGTRAGLLRHRTRFTVLLPQDPAP